MYSLLITQVSAVQLQPHFSYSDMSCETVIGLEEQPERIPQSHGRRAMVESGR